MVGDVVSKFPKEFSFSEGFLKDFQKEVILFLKNEEFSSIFEGKAYNADSLFSNYGRLLISRKVLNIGNVHYKISISNVSGTGDYLIVGVNERVRENIDSIHITLIGGNTIDSCPKKFGKPIRCDKRFSADRYSKGIKRIVNTIREHLGQYLDGLLCSALLSKEYFIVGYNKGNYNLGLNSHIARYTSGILDSKSIVKFKYKKD